MINFIVMGILNEKESKKEEKKIEYGLLLLELVKSLLYLFSVFSVENSPKSLIASRRK